MAIEQFRGDYYFLSNMYPVKDGIEAGEGVVSSCVEIPYQAGKFEDTDIRKVILSSEDGFEAKKKANRYEELGMPVRDDWDEIKIDVMKDLNYRKFSQNPHLARRLLHTGDEEIVQGNTHDDNFWGVSPPGNPEGQNWLGKIHMEVRQRLRSEFEDNP